MESSEQIIDWLESEMAGLPIGPGAGYRRKAHLSCEFNRNLKGSDLQALHTRAVATKGLKKIRQSHHALAKLLADGVSGPEASLITGYQTTTIHTLKNDPAFNELIEHYKSLKVEIYIDVHERLATLGMEIVDELRDRLHGEPETFKIKDLNETASLLLDRAGYGPKSTVQHTGGIAVLTEESLRRIKNEAEARRAGAVRTLSIGDGTIDSIPQRSAGEVQDQAEAERGESTGADLREEVHQVPSTDPPQ